MAVKAATKTAKTAASKSTTVLDVTCIGETAGAVWRALSEDGPMTIAKLMKAVNQSRDVVMQALGWLAREDKICQKEEGRNRLIALQECDM